MKAAKAFQLMWVFYHMHQMNAIENETFLLSTCKFQQNMGTAGVPPRPYLSIMQGILFARHGQAFHQNAGSADCNWFLKTNCNGCFYAKGHLRSRNRFSGIAVEFADIGVIFLQRLFFTVGGYDPDIAVILRIQNLNQCQIPVFRRKGNKILPLADGRRVPARTGFRPDAVCLQIGNAQRTIAVPAEGQIVNQVQHFRLKLRLEFSSQDIFWDGY